MVGKENEEVRLREEGNDVCFVFHFFIKIPGVTRPSVRGGKGPIRSWTETSAFEVDADLCS